MGRAHCGFKAPNGNRVPGDEKLRYGIPVSGYPPSIVGAWLVCARGWGLIFFRWTIRAVKQLCCSGARSSSS